MAVKYFFDSNTATFTYVISDDSSNKCAIIDPVLNYDQYSGTTSTKSADEIIDYLQKENLEAKWILETHIHADHLTAAKYLKEKLGAKIGIGKNVKEVLKFWVPIFNTHNDTNLDGSQFDHLFEDGEIIKIGSLDIKIIYTSGHTPACVSYLTKDSIFVGDTLLMPYVGTARTDFPGGSASTLYDSIQKILSLPSNINIYTCHDYPPQNKKPSPISTILEQKNNNIMINSNITKMAYVKARESKDKEMKVPQLLLPSIQFNLRAGSFGQKDNGSYYIKIPVDKI
jgi:glyoxylase-like metal-dependent hydrolase (beta-lactamase superfamily II)